MRTCGFSSARSTRAVISSTGWLKCECTLAMTMSISASVASARSSEPSARISTSMPARMRMPPFISSVDLADALHVGQRARIVEAVGHGQVLRVVGDRDVAQPARQRRLGHLADGVAAVGGLGVHVQIAANVGERNQLRQAARVRLAKLAAAASISPQFSRSSGGM